jgi:hypothetical protein
MSVDHSFQPSGHTLHLNNKSSLVATIMVSQALCLLAAAKWLS